MTVLVIAVLLIITMQCPLIRIVMTSVIMLNVLRVSVVVQNVTAPSNYQIDKRRVVALVGDGRAQPEVLLRPRSLLLRQVVDVQVVLGEVAFGWIPEDLDLVLKK